MIPTLQAAALNMDAICRTLGPESAEKKLLPVFLRLTQDDIWGVRKACAEAIVNISRALSPSARVAQLVGPFERMLGDSSKWVRNAAAQHLGLFISTLTGNKVPSSLLQAYIALCP